MHEALSYCLLMRSLRMSICSEPLSTVLSDSFIVSRFFSRKLRTLYSTCVYKDMHAYAYVSIRQHTSHTKLRTLYSTCVYKDMHASAYVSIRHIRSCARYKSTCLYKDMHTYAYVSIRQHTSAYDAAHVRLHLCIHRYIYLYIIHMFTYIYLI